jgi:uncharacterized protein YbcC (UPF0753/DUF2309 family)
VFRSAVDYAAHLLPAQGPITVFIHHNTLHAFEHQPFHQAVQEGAKRFGCEPYLPEARYRSELGRGRIRFEDLLAVLDEELGPTAAEQISQLTSRIELRLALLQYPLAIGSGDELNWFMAETDALRKVRPEASAIARSKLVAQTRRWVMRDLRGQQGKLPAWVQQLFARHGASTIETWSEANWEAFTLEALWQVCRDGVRQVAEPVITPRSVLRHRDLLLQTLGTDTDLWVHEVLIRFTAAFLDQGISHWPLPERERGYFHAFCSLYRRTVAPPDRWRRQLALETARLLENGISPIESACESLMLLGVPLKEWRDYLAATLLALRGWGGMVHQVEQRGDRVAHPIPGGSLIEFVAVRLLLDRIAAAHAAQDVLGYSGPLSKLRDVLQARCPISQQQRSVDERAFPVFQLAQIFGWSPSRLAQLSPDAWKSLTDEITAFSEVERRRVFHIAYERRFRDQCLDALALHQRVKVENPQFQVITCIDDREESFRRHLEEVAPASETFGAAGFFGIPMYYRGATDAHFVPLCPIVVTPKHWVAEQAEEQMADRHERLRRTHRLLGTAAHGAHIGSRTAALGAILTSTLGLLASIPLVARILFPRLTARIRNLFHLVVSPPPRTRLRLERDPTHQPGSQNGQLGFTLDELAGLMERLLRDIGLTRGFSRLVFILGHGSSSLNNPHKSAYDCGACGGSPGAPNGRAAAAALNDFRVRARLAARGIAIPDHTWFVGGYHNTCDDSVLLFDLDRLPETHRSELATIRRIFDEVSARNAHERCRRFMSAPLTLSFDEAKLHVENRSEDLAQTRPELGHATNAICHVGRRERTRGIFFDRRAFHTAYDPTQDDENGTILARTMAAVFPVCGGINLEYFFSHVDPMGYGCGTKLPHNITSLLGVMDGATSDLRTGLPMQMTEIHEPVRLLIICETTPVIMRKVLEGNPLGRTMTENEWIILAVQSPETNDLLLYRDGDFHPYLPLANSLPSAESSVDWYRGWRDHLEFAEINRGS